MQQLNPSFVLNGKSYTVESLLNHCNEVLIDSATKDWYKSIAKFTKEWFNGLAHVDVQTSGSTGTPKKMQLLKRHMANSARNTGTFFGLKPSNKALLCLPADFIAGKMMLVRAFELGLDLRTVEPNSTPQIDTTDLYDFAAMIPLQAEKSMSTLSYIKKLIIGGGKLSSSQVNLLSAIDEPQIYETYGMTETCTHIAVKPISSGYFCALPGVTINTDERNCLVINAPDVASSKIVTNDVVNIVDYIRFEILGRIDNVINTGGLKVIPENIEREIEGLIPNRFFITGLLDETLGQKVVLIIEGGIKKSTNDLLEEIRKKVKKNHHPKKIFIVDHFKETPTGKVLRDVKLYGFV